MSELTDLSEKQAGTGKTAETRTLQTIVKTEWQLFVKIFELVFCVICISLVMEPAKRIELAKTHLHQFALIFTTFIGYTLITSIFIVAKVIGDRLPYRTGFIFSMLASGLFFVCGIFLAIDRTHRYFFHGRLHEPTSHLLNLVVASSAFSFCSSLLFAFEAVVIWKFREDF